MNNTNSNNNFRRSSIKKKTRNFRKEKARMPKYRRSLRRHSVNNLLKKLTVIQNSANNDEPSNIRNNIYPIQGKRSKRQTEKHMRNEHYRCNVLKNKSEEINCHKKLQYYNVFVKTHISNFISVPSEVNANKLIDILIRLKHDTAFIFGDEYQTEIVKDFLMYLYNLNEDAYFMLEDHYRFNEMMSAIHVSKKSMLNKVSNTLSKMRSRGRVYPNNRRNTKMRSSLGRTRLRSRGNSSLDNL